MYSGNINLCITKVKKLRSMETRNYGSVRNLKMNSGYNIKNTIFLIAYRNRCYAD